MEHIQLNQDNIFSMNIEDLTRVGIWKKDYILAYLFLRI